MLLLVILAFRVALFTGQGVWDDGKVALIQMFRFYNFSEDTVDASFINSSPLNAYDVLVIPGGWAVNYRRNINSAGISHIRSFVQNGGVYVGICAGAYFASRTVVWEGRSYSYPLSLYGGAAIGPIDSIAPWPNYNMASINLQDSTEWVLYYGGPYFSGGNFDTIAIYNVNNEPAIIELNYGDGKVILSGVHPEIEEDSGRDSTNFASELPDSGSDWGWFIQIIENALNSISIEEKAIISAGKIPIPDGELFDITGRRIRGVPKTGFYLLRTGKNFRKILIVK